MEAELLQVAGAQQVVDVGKGRFGEQPDALGIDGQDVLALERIDGDIVAGNLAIGGGVVAEGKRSSAMGDLSMP